MDFFKKAKKAWPKRRRSESPLLVAVKLVNEDSVLGQGGGGVTTPLRIPRVRRAPLVGSSLAPLLEE